MSRSRNWSMAVTPVMPGDVYRKASKILWLAGAASTVVLFHLVFQASMGDTPVAWILGAAVGLGLQFVMTKIEGLLINGVLPAPWNVNWTGGGSVPFIVAAAMVVFLLDFITNIAGVNVFMSVLATQTGDVSTIGINAKTLIFLIPIMTVLFGALLALGSELLDAVADHVDGVARPVYQMQTEPEPFIVATAKQQKTLTHQIDRLDKLEKVMTPPSSGSSETDQILAAIRARRAQSK